MADLTSRAAPGVGTLRNENTPAKRLALKRPAIAILLSILIPGSGQLYNRQIWKGVEAAAILFLVSLTCVYLRLPLSFRGLILIGLIEFLLWAPICADSLHIARKHQLEGKEFKRRESLVALCVGAALALLGWFSPVQSYFRSYWRAFRTPSESMCPTLCSGDRFVVQMDAFRFRPPKAGDLVMFNWGPDKALFIKRVAAVGGDQVTVSGNDVFINGKKYELPIFPCAADRPFPPGEAAAPPSQVEMQASELFVVGDNWQNSYDSRYFGVIRLNQVIGKPMYIYWSPQHSRIGCALH